MVLRVLLRFFLLVSFFCFGVLVPQARADQYLEPTWPNLVKTLIRFNAIPMSDMALLDEFALVTECDMYKAFYKDDFKWNQVRQALTQSIQNDIGTYPTRYRYVAPWQLDRYDFQSRIFRFYDDKRISNVNTFTIYSVIGTPCDAKDILLLPRSYHAVIADPIYMDGLPIAEEDAKKLLEDMKQAGNDRRVIWLSFNMRIVYVQPLVKKSSGTTQGVAGRYDVNVHYQQPDVERADWVRLDARMESIEVYEDKDLTKLIYKIQL